MSDKYISFELQWRYDDGRNAWRTQFFIRGTREEMAADIKEFFEAPENEGARDDRQWRVAKFERIETMDVDLFLKL